MFKQDPGTGQWQTSAAADAICSAIDPADPNLKTQALAAYLEYITWTESQVQASWVP